MGDFFGGTGNPCVEPPRPSDTPPKEGKPSFGGKFFLLPSINTYRFPSFGGVGVVLPLDFTHSYEIVLAETCAYVARVRSPSFGGSGHIPIANENFMSKFLHLILGDFRARRHTKWRSVTL
jgi:hypothetical protein